MMKLSLENWSHLATIFAAGVTAWSLGFGYAQYLSTTEAQRDASAVSLYLEYLKFMREVEKDEPPFALAVDASASSPHVRTEIPRAPTATIPSAIVTAGEAIYLLRKGDRGWELTVQDMIQNNAELLRSVPWECDTLVPDFEVMLKTLAKITCTRDRSK